MNQLTYHRAGFLEAESWTSGEMGCLAGGAFDLVIAASSWDQRSVALTAADYTASNSALLLFTARDSHGLRDHHDTLLSTHLAKTCKQHQEIKGQSGDVTSVWTRLEEVLCSTARRVGRPLNVLLDLSACPRYYSIGILGCGFRRGLVRQVSVVYAEGRYSSVKKSGEVAFTGGRWRTVSAPFFEGICDPGKRRFFLVSVGFEGGKTYRAVSRADPDRVSLLFPSPGVDEKYVGMAERENKNLCDDFCIPTDQIVTAYATDAVAGWRALDESGLDRPDEENSYYLCCGSKPHSIALALRALTIDGPAVLYNVPDEHVVHDTVPNGTFWLYRITDLSAGK